MLNSTVLEVAIGLVFCYASVALIASSVYEAIASWLNLRSKILFTGVTNLLNAKGDSAQGQELLLKIYNDALVHPAGHGSIMTTAHLAKEKLMPAYIPSKNFALALLQGIQQVSGKFENLSADINAIKDPQLRQLLQGFHHKAAGDLQSFQSEIAEWFDASMGRVSGLYKKRSQFWCFFIALVISVAFNIDSVHLFKTLWLHPALVAELHTDDINRLAATTAYDQLKLLPIGWNEPFTWSLLKNPALIIGWLVTASASLFGAPFWFDALKTLVHLRGTGTKPDSESAKKDAAIK